MTFEKWLADYFPRHIDTHDVMLGSDLLNALRRTWQITQSEIVIDTNDGKPPSAKEAKK